MKGYRILKLPWRLLRLSDVYYYWPPGGGRLFDIKVVSSYVFLRTNYMYRKKNIGKMFKYVITYKGNVLLFKT